MRRNWVRVGDFDSDSQIHYIPHIPKYTPYKSSEYVIKNLTLHLHKISGIFSITVTFWNFQHLQTVKQYILRRDDTSNISFWGDTTVRITGNTNDKKYLNAFLDRFIGFHKSDDVIFRDAKKRIASVPIIDRGFHRSIEEHRKRIRNIKSITTSEKTPYKDFLIFLPSSKDPISIRLYRPDNITPPYSTAFYIPGTAFVAGEINAATHPICSRIAKESGCQLFVLSHRLAPEHPFPTSLLDIYYLFNRIMGTPSFCIDSNRVALIGYSSGANLAINLAVSITTLAKENPSITRLILISPIVDLSRSLKKFKNEFEDKDTVIMESFVEWFLKLYVPKSINPRYPWLSPFWHKPVEFRGLPPTELIYGEFDRFRSDNEGFSELLKLKAKVNLLKLIVEGGKHTMLWYRPEISQAIGSRIRTAFGFEPIPKAISLENYPDDEDNKKISHSTNTKLRR